MIVPEATDAGPVKGGIVSFKQTVGEAVVMVPTEVISFSITVKEAIALVQLPAPEVTSTLITSPPSITIDKAVGSKVLVELV